MSITKPKRHRLRKLRLDEISLVDKGACEDATITIFKRGDPDMTDLEKMQKAMEDATASIEKLTKRAEEAEERATKAEAEVAKAKTEAPVQKSGAEGDDEEILKGADPAVRDMILKLRKSNEASEQRLAKLDDERDIAKAVDVCKRDFSHLPVKADEFGPVLKRAMGTMDQADFEELNRVLKAADNAMLEATRMVGPGGHVIAKGSAEQKLEDLAKKRAEEKGENFAKSYADVMDENPQLYAEYQRESRPQ